VRVSLIFDERDDTRGALPNRMSFVKRRAMTTCSSEYELRRRTVSRSRIANLEGVSMVSKARARADPAL
jgi:hypothetical protein